jgi:hypothetical protein
MVIALYFLTQFLPKVQLNLAAFSQTGIVFKAKSVLGPFCRPAVGVKKDYGEPL